MMARMNELETENVRLKKMYIQEKLNAENEQIANWLIRLTDSNHIWGFWLCYLYLHNVKIYPWNHKHIYRIYRKLELNLRIKPRKSLLRDNLDALVEPT